MGIDFQKRHLRGENVLNEKELLILASLRKDARKSISDISKDTNIPISTVFDKITRFEKGLIKNYSSLIDFNKIGYHARANIALKVDKENKEELLRFLLSHKNVNSIYRLHNQFDFLVECIFKTIPEVENFAEKLELDFKILDKHILHITEDIQREKFLTQEDHF